MKLKHFYINQPLKEGEILTLPKELSRRLSKVLRLKKGARIALFNGVDGLFEAEILDEKSTQVSIKKMLSAQTQKKSKMSLVIALTKKEAMDKVFRQGTEMGVDTFIPVTTEFSVSKNVNKERVEAMFIEASEQCERLTIPTLSETQKLEKFIEGVVIDKKNACVLWCAEHVGGTWGNHSVVGENFLLVGPEGGFSEAERKLLSAQKFVTPVGLGETILRVDTAVVAALALLKEGLA